MLNASRHSVLAKKLRIFLSVKEPRGAPGAPALAAMPAACTHKRCHALTSPVGSSMLLKVGHGELPTRQPRGALTDKASPSSDAHRGLRPTACPVQQLQPM